MIDQAFLVFESSYKIDSLQFKFIPGETSFNPKQLLIAMMDEKSRKSIKLKDLITYHQNP